MAKTSSYREALLESLTDPLHAKLYLNAVLEEYPEGFLKALRNVAQAQGEMSRLAQEAGIKRESLYRALSNVGNPTLNTFQAVLSALGLKFSIDTFESANEQPPHGKTCRTFESRSALIGDGGLSTQIPPKPYLIGEMQRLNDGMGTAQLRKTA